MKFWPDSSPSHLERAKKVDLIGVEIAAGDWREHVFNNSRGNETTYQALA